MSDQLGITVFGASGRMGRELLRLIELAPDLGLRGSIAGAPDSDDAVAAADVVVDFSTPAGCQSALRACLAHGTPLVSGTTGLGEELRAELDRATVQIPVIWAANFSVGVHVLAHLVQLASSAMPGFDIEVFEAHHRNKVDAPSGTARLLGAAAAAGRDATLEDVAKLSRAGHTGPRTDAEIGFQVVRGGSIVGEHTVFLCGDGERLELTHRAQDRSIFAAGALRAARWIANREPGLYTMPDVLFGS